VGTAPGTASERHRHRERARQTEPAARDFGRW
jgi:hypothetical protein